jgi:PKD domain
MPSLNVVCRSVFAAFILAGALVATGGVVPANAGGLTLSASPNPALVAETVTFTFSPKVMADGDTLTIDFGDGDQTVVAFSTYCALFGGCSTATHSYTQFGTFTVMAQGTIGGTPVSASLAVAITAGSSIYVLAAAHAPGANGTVWRTDLEVYNAGSATATYTITLLPRGTDNLSASGQSFTVPPGTATRHTDVLYTDFGFTGSAALRISPTAGKILVTSRTYNLGVSGTYGQFVPAVPLAQAIGEGQTAYLLQLSHDPGLKVGFRTNVGLVNPTPVDEDVTLTFYSSDGTSLGTTTYTLKPYDYEQLDRAFELVTSNVVDDGFVTVSNVGNGLFFAYASVVDNITGDPTLIPVVTP